MVGVVSPQEALAKAQDVGLDLVEVSPNATPPVCKILDYGKYKYQMQKKANEARKKQKIVEVKEVKIRPGIDTHDFDIKMKNVFRFLDDGDKVKISMRFRGREMEHQHLGMELYDKVKELVADKAKIENDAKMEGRQAIMIIAPIAS